MSQPSIPNITPDIDINLEEAITLQVAAIALEELGLAHLINAEAEKIQAVLGTLEPRSLPEAPTFAQLLEIDQAVENVLERVIMKEMILLFKLERLLEFLVETAPEEGEE